MLIEGNNCEGHLITASCMPKMTYRKIGAGNWYRTFREWLLSMTEQPYAATTFLRVKKRETTRRPCALFMLASPFNLPVTTEKLKLRPSGSDGIGSAFPRETKPDCSDYHRARGEEEAERSRVSCKLKSTTASPVPLLPPSPAAFTATRGARYI